MCIVGLLLKQHPLFDVCLVHGRDEFLDRPTTPADPSQALFCGIDGKIGGTWGGFAPGTGRAMFLTNVRRVGAPAPEEVTSRGLFVLAWLKNGCSGIPFLLEPVGGFNTLSTNLWSEDPVLFVTNGAGGMEIDRSTLDSGVHVMSNSTLDDLSWPKCAVLKAKLERLEEKPTMEHEFSSHSPLDPLPSELVADLREARKLVAIFAQIFLNSCRIPVTGESFPWSPIPAEEERALQSHIFLPHDVFSPFPGRKPYGSRSLLITLRSPRAVFAFYLNSDSLFSGIRSAKAPLEWIELVSLRPQYVCSCPMTDLYLAESAAPCTGRDEESNFDLAIQAIRHDDPLALRWILENSGDLEGEDHPLLDKRGEDGLPLVSHAATTRRTFCLQMLLHWEADANGRRYDDGSTSLHLAAAVNNVAAVELLVGELSVHCRDTAGRTPLTVAVLFDAVEAAVALLEAGARLDVVARDLATPLDLCCASGSLKMAQALLRYQNAAKAASSPLIAAIQAGNTGIVRLLLQSGSSPSAVDEETLATPLFLAASQGRTGIVETLLEFGADPKETCENGSSPLWIAAANGQTETIKVLMEHGAPALTFREDGVSALHMAAQEGHCDCLMLLLEVGINPNLQSLTGMTPLFSAVTMARDSAVSLLLAHGAEVNCCLEDGEGAQTPLTLAIECGILRIVQLLLQAGADANATCSNETTGVVNALQFALHHRRFAMIPFLAKHGATATLASAVATGERWLMAGVLSEEEAKDMRDVVELMRAEM